MAYSTNPNLPKARAIAMQLLVREHLPLQTVANRCGVHRRTIWRWKRKWDKLNTDVQLTNDNRPNQSQRRSKPVSAFRLAAVTWHIPTLTSTPHTSPKALSGQLVARVVELRSTLRRCAEVIWYHMVYKDRLRISLSSVRLQLLVSGRKKRVRPDNPRRPHATKPGALVQTDTIHHVDPHSRRRWHYYTVIDLCTRMAHTVLTPRLGPGLAAQAVVEAQQAWGFSTAMVQADNGPEYGRHFAEQLARHGITVRHSRLHRPNDNAHIERFNRTIQTECIGHYWRRSVPLPSQEAKLATWLEYYNTTRVHLGIQMRTPREMLQRS